jgi:hypothetical protein
MEQAWGNYVPSVSCSSACEVTDSLLPPDAQNNDQEPFLTVLHDGMPVSAHFLPGYRYVGVSCSTATTCWALLDSDTPSGYAATSFLAAVMGGAFGMLHPIPGLIGVHVCRQPLSGRHRYDDRHLRERTGSGQHDGARSPVASRPDRDPRSRLRGGWAPLSAAGLVSRPRLITTAPTGPREVVSERRSLHKRSCRVGTNGASPPPRIGAAHIGKRVPAAFVRGLAPAVSSS